MSLDRKDVRFKLNPADHAALSVLAEVADADIGEFVELIVTRELARRIHAAKVIAERTACWGTSGNRRELPGRTGRGEE